MLFSNRHAAGRVERSPTRATRHATQPITARQRPQRSPARVTRPLALAGAVLFAGFGATGCFFLDEDESHATREVRLEIRPDAVEIHADGRAEGEALHAEAERVEAAQAEWDARARWESRSDVHVDVDMDELRDGLHEMADALADGLSEAAERVSEALQDVDLSGLDLSGEGMVEQPVGFREIYGVLPERAAGFDRTDREGSTGGAFGLRYSVVEAEYENRDGARADVTVADIGAMPFAGSGGLTDILDGMSLDSESSRGYERTTDYRGYPAVETFRGSRSNRERGRAEFTWVVEGRFLVHVEGRRMTRDELYDLRDAIDTRALARMRDREG